MTNAKMVEYYAKRAAEYEHIYLKPERQEDLKTLQAKLSGCFKGLDLLEIACGTGYWTQFACRSARSIVATDCNEPVLDIANRKHYGDCPVSFQIENAYALENVKRLFSSALVGFWWSHVPKSKLGDFLRILHSKLCNGAYVIIFDNRYVEGSSTRIHRADEEGNTYQIRGLSNGSQHEVLKNFPTRSELIEWIEPLSNHSKFTELDYFWIAEYTLRKNAEQGVSF